MFGGTSIKREAGKELSIDLSLIHILSKKRRRLATAQQRAKTGHGDAVEMPRHVAQGRKAAVTGDLILIHRGERGTVAGIIYWLELIHSGVTTSVIRSTRA